MRGLGEFYEKNLGATKKKLKCGCVKYFMIQPGYGSDFGKSRMVYRYQCKRHFLHDFKEFDKWYSKHMRQVENQKGFTNRESGKLFTQ